MEKLHDVEVMNLEGLLFKVSYEGPHNRTSTRISGGVY